jgi:hypothetical protein
MISVATVAPLSRSTSVPWPSPLGSGRTRMACRPVQTSTPSASSAWRANSPTSGFSRPTSRLARCTTVTLVPMQARNWPSSTPCPCPLPWPPGAWPEACADCCPTSSAWAGWCSSPRGSTFSSTGCRCSPDAQRAARPPQGNPSNRLRGFLDANAGLFALLAARLAVVGVNVLVASRRRRPSEAEAAPNGPDANRLAAVTPGDAEAIGDRCCDTSSSPTKRAP